MSICHFWDRLLICGLYFLPFSTTACFGSLNFDITGLDSVLELKVGESVCITGKHARILASLSNLFRSVLYDNLDST
jgi:hypothetical protein